MEWDISFIWELNYWDTLGEVPGIERLVDLLLSQFFHNLSLTVRWLAFDISFQTENFSLINLKHQL